MIKTIIRLFLLLFFIGCTNLFTTREDKVEKPDPGTVSTVFEEPTEPIIVLNNLSRAIEGANSLEYAKLFSNPAIKEIPTNKHFRFSGDANFSSRLPNPWTFTEERNYFLNMISSEDNNKPTFTFSFVDSLPSSRLFTAIDSVETDFIEYEIVIKQPDNSEEVYFGFSNFKLFKSATANEAWYIYAWEDRAKEEAFNQSWTALKAENQ